MAKFPFPRKARTSSSYDEKGPQQNPDFKQGGASAGETFSPSELPIIPVHGGNPARLTGRPNKSPTEPKLPLNSPATAPPSGPRK
jgi:hypothetical protein